MPWNQTEIPPNVVGLHAVIIPHKMWAASYLHDGYRALGALLVTRVQKQVPDRDALLGTICQTLINGMIDVRKGQPVETADASWQRINEVGSALAFCIRRRYFYVRFNDETKQIDIKDFAAASPAEARDLLMALPEIKEIEQNITRH